MKLKNWFKENKKDILLIMWGDFGAILFVVLYCVGSNKSWNIFMEIIKFSGITILVSTFIMIQVTKQFKDED
jgi:hypothetical protein